jgi:hypothetical protein
MSILESTISMLRVLPESEVQIFITRAMLEKRPSPFAAVSRESVIRDIDLSTEQFARGKACEVRKVISDLKVKYGL